VEGIKTIMDKSHDLDSYCGLRSEPDGAPNTATTTTTRSGSSTSVVGGMSCSPNKSKEGSVCSDRQLSSSPQNTGQGNRDIDGGNNASSASQIFNISCMSSFTTLLCHLN